MPVSHELTLAAAATAHLLCDVALAAPFLLQFPCVACPGEARCVRWGGVAVLDETTSSRYPACFGIVSVRGPKTRRQAVHATTQRVLNECAGVASYLSSAQGAAEDGGLLFDGAGQQNSQSFQRILRRLCCAGLRLTLAGVRGGGATDYVLWTRNAPALR